MQGHVAAAGVRGHLARVLGRAPAVGAAVVVFSVGAAGFLKLYDLSAFRDSVSRWALVPPLLEPFLVVLVPVAEVAILAWWLQGDRVRSVIACAGMLAGFTVLYAVHWASRGPPPCGCLGFLGRYWAWIEHARWVMARNVAMVAVLLVHVAAASIGPRAQRSRAGQPLRAPARSGYTVVEVLLAVAFCATLAALLAPSLAGVSDSSRRARDLANLRSHAQVFAAYAADYRDLFPALTSAQATFSIIRCESAGIVLVRRYFDAFANWNVGLADQYYAGAWNSPSFRSPWAGAGGWSTSYTMACSLIASPAYYNRLTREEPPAQLVPQRHGDVLFPSAKAILVADPPDWGRTAGPWVGVLRAAMADGGGLSVHLHRVTPEHWTEDGRYPAYVSYHLGPGRALPMTHTIDGVRGRDMR
jgi:type II secretory pathway pseudopilin PulG